MGSSDPHRAGNVGAGGTSSLLHRDADAALHGHLLRLLVSGVHMPDHAHAGVVGQHPFQFLPGQWRAVRDTDLPGVDGPAMPTPPPWWMLTQDAPDAVLTRALSSGQSAIASEPSAMPSVSR